MSARGASVAELDDAAFRARLAPLAREVLPGGGEHRPAASDQPKPRSKSHLAAVSRTTVLGASAQPAADMWTADRPARGRRRRILAAVPVAAVLVIAGGIHVRRPSFTPSDYNVSSGASAGHDAPGAAVPSAAVASSALAMQSAVTRPSAPLAPSNAAWLHAAATLPAAVVSSAASMQSAVKAPPAIAAMSGAAAPHAVASSAAVPSSAAVASSGAAAPSVAAAASVAAVSSAPVVLSTAAARAEDIVSVLLRRGDAALASGDIAAARMVYERAAAQGSAAAAIQIGKTYDVAFLLEIGARGTQADQAKAAAWFRKAAAFGDAAPGGRPRRLEGKVAP
jgi:hypothetical protein